MQSPDRSGWPDVLRPASRGPTEHACGFGQDCFQEDRGGRAVWHIASIPGSECDHQDMILRAGSTNAAKGLPNLRDPNAHAALPLARVTQPGNTAAMFAFNSHMGIAMAEAAAAMARGEVPVGAVLLGPDGKMLAHDGNRTRERNDPTAHAEMLVIRTGAEKLGNERLIGCDLYVTLEPCPMCAAAISAARIARLYYGAPDPKSGGVAQGPRVFSHPQCHHKPEVYDGIGANAAEAMMKDFFRTLRDHWTQ